MSAPHKLVYVLLSSGEEMTFKMPARLDHRQVGARVNATVGSVAIAFRTRRTTWDRLEHYPNAVAK